MATQIETRLIDDLDGSPADESVKFSLDGVEYSIDLTDAHAKEMRHALRKWTDHAARTGGKKKTTRNVNGVSKTVAIRAWAAENGIKVAERGRIPQEIVDRYEARASA